MSTFERIRSGLPGLDSMLDSIRMGDNVVWQVSSMDDYMHFVTPLCNQLHEEGKELLYMHFSGHPALLQTGNGIRVYEFDPSEGFEAFTMNVRRRIKAEGRDAFYVFDCLSDLQAAWATDLMMGNFFKVTCPYLFELNTVAYFPLLRGQHSFDAVARIQETTQLLLDVYTDSESLYINPLKVWNRYSPNMFLPHKYMEENGSFLPLKGGYEISRFYTLVDALTNTSENQNLDSWERFITDTRRTYRREGIFTPAVEDIISHTMMSNDEKILSLLKTYFEPDDYFLVYKRMIGTGTGNAVRTVYASTMNPSALEYRRQRGLGFKDEQMALLIQRVSGSMYEDFLMPNAAGVGYSYSAYKWDDSIDASDGMLRLVMGLGTRAVDRTEGDYPRIVNLSAPERSTLTESWAKHQYSQRYVDLMDYTTKSLSSRPLKDVTPYMDSWYKKLVLEHDSDAERTFRERGQRREILFANCEGLVRNTEFTGCMKSLLHTLQQAYQYPVDIEFTINGTDTGEFVFNLLQCRPLQVGTRRDAVTVPSLPEDKTVFSVTGSSMGGSRAEDIDYVVFVDSRAYYEFPYKRKPDIAHIIGDINHHFRKSNQNLLLFVPGRIGTSSPELGVPVSFAAINHFCAICEMSDSEVGYMPELSYGSHMFQDLVEAEIFYTALFDTPKTRIFNRTVFHDMPNILTEILPDCKEYEDIVKVCHTEGMHLKLYSDIQNSETVLGFES